VRQKGDAGRTFVAAMNGIAPLPRAEFDQFQANFLQGLERLGQEWEAKEAEYERRLAHVEGELARMRGVPLAVRRPSIFARVVAFVGRIVGR
jgi:hypothetical protein